MLINRHIGYRIAPIIHWLWLAGTNFQLFANPWQTYTNANFINDMVAVQNQLYCATKGGLAIFAKESLAFSQVITNTEGLVQNQCLCIAHDKMKNLWIGTEGGGLVVYTPQTKIFQNYRPAEMPTKIKCISIASDTILVGSEKGFYVINTHGTYLNPDDDRIKHFKKTTFPQMASDDILAFAITDRFWIGTRRGLLSLNKSLDTLTLYPSPLGDSVSAMVVVAETLFLATELGIAKFNGIGFDTILLLPVAVSDLAYRLNRFYLATEKGLIRYDFQTVDTIWHEPTQTLLVDSFLFGGLGGAKDWGYGLRIISDTTDTIWQSFVSDGLQTNSIFSVITDNAGRIYTSHNTNLLSRLDLAGNWTALYSPLYNGRVLAKDSHNRIWVGHFSHRGGLSYYDPSSNLWQILQWGDFSPRNIINALGIDQHDTKWVWTVRDNSGASIVRAIDANNNEIEFDFGITSPPGREGGYEFGFDTKNRVWLGTQQGLLMFDYNGTLFSQTDDTWQLFTSQAGLPSREVVTLAVDPKDRIWLGTASGGGVLDNGKFSPINPPLCSDIKKIRIDAWGNVWFLTARGLSCYNPNTKNWTNYNQNNSQIIPNPDPLNLTSFYTCLHIDARQEFLLVGTQAGLSKFELKDTISPTLSSVRVFPNPCIKGLHSAVTFDSLPTNSKILIYTLNSKFLTKLKVNPANHQAYFDIKDCASGIYLALIITPTGTKICKFAIIR